MKLAFIVSGKAPTTMTGGLGSYSYSIAESLAQLGYRVFVIGVSESDEIVKGDFCDFIHVRTPLRKLASVSAFLMMELLERRIVAIIEEYQNPEVLIFGAGIWGSVGNRVKRSRRDCRIHSVAAYFTTFEHEYAGQKAGCPARDYGSPRAIAVGLLHRIVQAFYVPKEHETLRQLDLVIVHYESTRRILLAEVPGLDPGRIVKIPYYVNHFARKGELERVGARVKSKRICCICRQDPRKGINTLLHALRLLMDRGFDFECLIAGNGPFRKVNERLARELCIEDRVSFPGFVSSVEDTLKTADIYAFPSVEEGSGAISLLEAMEAGLPIVTTYCDGIPEDFTHGVNGLLVPPGNAGAMAEALARLLMDEALAAALGSRVGADYRQRFTREGMTQGLAELMVSKAWERAGGCE